MAAPKALVSSPVSKGSREGKPSAGKERQESRRLSSGRSQGGDCSLAQTGGKESFSPSQRYLNHCRVWW